jgi:NAD(P)-dependent dehydrogenase (short-subunit alcohol dehydrogenase family)
MEISGKKAIIVGGASGMGRASAELLAARGASVAILDRSSSDGKAVADDVGGAFFEVDVTDFDGTESALQGAVDELGGLHVTVTTAGGGMGKRTLSKDGPHSLDEFRQVIDLRLGRPDEYATLVAAIVENPMLNGQCIRLDAGQRFAPK